MASFLMENANGVIPYSAMSFQARNGETTFHHLHIDISAAVLMAFR
jgi:hypothetical protein